MAHEHNTHRGRKQPLTPGLNPVNQQVEDKLDALLDRLDAILAQARVDVDEGIKALQMEEVITR